MTNLKVFFLILEVDTVPKIRYLYAKCIKNTGTYFTEALQLNCYSLHKTHHSSRITGVKEELMERESFHQISM